MNDRRSNIEGIPVEHEADPSNLRPGKVAREQQTSDESLAEREDVREEGGIGYTEEGRHWDRAEKAEEGGEH